MKRLALVMVPTFVFFGVACTEESGDSDATGAETGADDAPGDTTGGEGDGDSGDGDGAETGGDGDGAAPTWDGGMDEFFETYCWNCHGPGDAEDRDYSRYDHVMRDGALIRCGTAETTPPGCGPGDPAAQLFPIADPRPSPEERDAVVAWIDAGMP